MRVVKLRHSALDGFAVGNLRLAHVGFDAEFAAHAVHQDVQVELAHAADFGLAGVFVEGDGERRVLSGELLDSRGELLLVTLGLRLDGNEDHGIREGHGFQHDRVCRIAQGVTGGGVLEADHCVDVARVDLVYRHFLVGVHLEELANAFLLLLGRVQQLGTGSCLAGVHADEVQLAEERVRRNLERQSRERLGFGRLARISISSFCGS